MLLEKDGVDEDSDMFRISGENRSGARMSNELKPAFAKAIVSRSWSSRSCTEERVAAGVEVK